MKSNLLKALLLASLVTITVVSFLPRLRTKEATLTPPPELSAPRVTVQTQPIRPAAEWTETWGRYTYAGEEFSVEMPEMPFAYEPGGGVGSTGDAEPLRVFGLYSGGVVLLVASFDGPRADDWNTHQSIATYNWPDSNFPSARGVGAGEFHGAEYLYSGGYFRRARVFNTRRHAYLVCAISADADNPRAAHFLDSFALGGRPEGKGIREPPPPAGVVPVEPPGVEGGVGPGSGLTADRAPGEPYYINEVSREAIVVFKPAPGYTNEAKRGGVTGTVKLRAVLTEGGKVERISVVEGLPRGLTEKAVAAARHVLFFPAVRNGRAVSQWATLEYNFDAR